MIDVHDELHRLILRKRWIIWSLRTSRAGDYNLKTGRHIRLSHRLSDWRPTWEQRHKNERYDHEEF